MLQLLQKDDFLDQFTFTSLTLILQIDSLKSEDVLFLMIGIKIQSNVKCLYLVIDLKHLRKPTFPQRSEDTDLFPIYLIFQDRESVTDLELTRHFYHIGSLHSVLSFAVVIFCLIKSQFLECCPLLKTWAAFISSSFLSSFSLEPTIVKVLGSGWDGSPGVQLLVLPHIGWSPAGLVDESDDIESLRLRSGVTELTCRPGGLLPDLSSEYWPYWTSPPYPRPLSTEYSHLTWSLDYNSTNSPGLDITTLYKKKKLQLNEIGSDLLEKIIKKI